MAVAPNFFENLLLALVQSGEAVAPIFIHSQQGMLVFNATEPILNGALAQVVAQQQKAPDPRDAQIAKMQKQLDDQAAQFQQVMEMNQQLGAKVQELSGHATPVTVTVPGPKG